MYEKDPKNKSTDVGGYRKVRFLTNQTQRVIDNENTQVEEGSTWQGMWHVACPIIAYNCMNDCIFLCRTYMHRC